MSPSTRRVAVVGMSLRTPCGVRDHARALADAMVEQQLSGETHWLTRTDGSFRHARAEAEAWLEALSGKLRHSPPDVVLLHYSVFSYSYRGIPVFVPRVLATLRRAETPMIAFLHEFVFPWNGDGLPGKLWALSQRLALVDVMRTASGIVLTTSERERWLASRPWLPRRAAEMAPVFSNLPPPEPMPSTVDGPPIIGVFGYTYGPAVTSLVLDSMRLLLDQETRATLQLLGAPGASSRVGEEWIAAARSRGIADALSFSGLLPATELSDALARCRVLLFADPSGPSSRKGTLAAALASGVPVVAFAGRRWPEIVERGALTSIEPSAQAVSRTVARLLYDFGASGAAGARGKAFAEEEMSAAQSAVAVRRLVDAVVA